MSKCILKFWFLFLNSKTHFKILNFILNYKMEFKFLHEKWRRHEYLQLVPRPQLHLLHEAREALRNVLPKLYQVALLSQVHLPHRRCN
jgi:hypothetical protein